MVKPEHPVALITGAGTGVGRAITHRLANAGHLVVLCGRRLAPLELTLADVPREPGSFAARTDVSELLSVDALFSEIERRAGRLDLLVNNAGVFGPSAAVEEYPLDAWQKTVATNLTGAFLCAQAAFRQMLRQRPPGGRIINIGSMSAHTPRPGAVAYTVTKHGITGLTKSLALEGRRYGIACCQIDIGNAATEMTSQIAAGALQPDGSKRPEPTISVEYVADAVLYVARLPLEANVLTMTVMASGMPFVGRG